MQKWLVFDTITQTYYWFKDPIMYFDPDSGNLYVNREWLEDGGTDSRYGDANIYHNDFVTRTTNDLAIVYSRVVRVDSKELKGFMERHDV